ncbi:MAG: helix-hairpin-helix domain-containing protein, partial [Balneolaceae bacterium]
MSDHCENNTKLQRDGTSRQQRLPDALLPDYVDIDGRGLKELIGFVQEFSEEINYYDSENKTEEDWNWKGFFESDPAIEEILLNDEQDGITNFKEYVKEKGGYTEPHMALFLAFLKLFEIAQGDLNKITKKHLDHYYKKILQIGKQPAVADQVFLIFSLARHVEGSHLVEEGTALKAGKDATGRPLAYETNRDLIVNHGQVDQVKALFMDTGRDHRLYESPIANSADGRGAEIETDDMSWKTFGGDDRQQADIGFSIASPLLRLAEGNRTVSVTLQFEKSARTRSILEQMSPDRIPASRYAFKVLFSGEEEWISPLDEEFVMEEDSIHPDVARALLNFVNTATADAIASQVKDDPNRGYSSVRSGYTIGITVAKRIVEKREEKGNFVEIKELKEVSGLGKDKIHDLIYTFSKQIHATHFNPEEGTLTIVRTLDESQPPVTGYNRKNLEDPIETEWPVMKVVLNKNVPPRQDNGHPFTYKHLRDLTVEEAELNVDVEGVKTNVIQNDSGSLDPGKPFQPFGNHPVIGSSFYIGNWEIFQKNLDKLWININWHDLPDESFKAHYDFYTASAESRKNSSFETDIAILNDRKWQTLKSGAKLFDFETDGDEEGDPVNPENTICLVEDSLGEIQRDPAMSGVDLYGTDTQKGFIRLRLQGADFGHKDYAPSYSSQIVVAVTADNGGNNGGNGNGNDPNLPKEPYTPTISELSLD